MRRMMLPQRAQWIGLSVLGPLGALVSFGVVSCSDSKATPGYPVAGGSISGGVGAAPAGGSPGTGGDPSSFGNAGSPSSASGNGGQSASAGSGGGGSSAVNGGSGGGGSSFVPIYTIEGCTDDGAGGGDGGGGAGGESAAGGHDGEGEGGSSEAHGEGGSNATSRPTRPDVFASFTLYDCATDKPVQTCVDKTDDFTVTVTGGAPLTVLTNVAPGVGAGSVIFTYDGVPQLAHNLYPYALGEDDNGDFHQPNPPLNPGQHTVAMTAYELADGQGAVLGTASVVISVVNEAP